MRGGERILNVSEIKIWLRGDRTKKEKTKSTKKKNRIRRRPSAKKHPGLGGWSHRGYLFARSGLELVQQ